MRRALQLSAAVTVLLAGTSALAQENSPLHPPARTGYDSTYQRHFGFYIRPDLGFGYMTASESNTTISGFSGLFSIAIGGAIAEDNILAVQIFDSYAQNPNVYYNGSSTPTNGASITMWGIGPQYTHYFMPSNVYLSTTLGFTRMHSSSGTAAGASNWGGGGRVGLGKEWWVSDHWGLGFVGHVSFSTNQDAGITLTTWTFGLAFSATYN